MLFCGLLPAVTLWTKLLSHAAKSSLSISLVVVLKRSYLEPISLCMGQEWGPTQAPSALWFHLPRTVSVGWWWRLRQVDLGTISLVYRTSSSIARAREKPCFPVRKSHENKSKNQKHYDYLLLKKNKNLSTWEAEALWPFWVGGQPGL